MDERASVAVVVFRESPAGRRFLLLRRAPAKGGGWQPVTGRVEAGEEAAQAARRETEEETGCAPVALVDLGLEHAFTGFDGNRYRERAFAAELAADAAHRASDEHDAAEWLPGEEALARLTWEENRAAVRCLEQMLDGPSEGGC